MIAKLLTQRQTEIKSQLSVATNELKIVEANVNKLLGAMAECNHQLVLANTMAIKETPEKLKGDS